MKKLLALTGLAALLILTACGGNSGGDETVCTFEDSIHSVRLTVESEDGQVTSVNSEERIDITDWDEEEIEEEKAWAEADGLSCSVSGSTLVCTGSEDVDNMELDDFVDRMESRGATCN